ncbi:MAG: polysaccharide deacetylase family protein [Nitrospirae bacterium]|nr:polysaccharide deacetylase family protein [Nitrospirota bacterium]
MFRLDRFITLNLIEPLARLKQNTGIRIPILMYHSISYDDERRVPPYFRVATSPEVFARHMDFLANNGYRVIGLEAAVERLRTGGEGENSSEEKAVVITFDDGFLDFYTDAFPILSSHGFTATVYLPTSFIDAVNNVIIGKQFLSWDHVNELVKGGITFGSHTVSHKYLDLIPHADVERELRQSRDIIEQRTGSRVRTFSFPYGFPEHNKEFVTFLADTLHACGYIGAVTTSIGTARHEKDSYFLRRIPINTDDDIELFQAKLNGSYDWLHAPQYLVKATKGVLGIRKRRKVVQWTAP